MTDLHPQWKTIDSWWQANIEQQEEDLQTLRNRIAELHGLWTQSECLFDQDPSKEDWTETSPQAGPLRDQEENWSQWVAHLLRSSAILNQRLFGSSYDTAPTSTRCEQAYHDEELQDRRVDIEARWPSSAISIEVKINDEAYEKTPQTAHLIELNNSGYEWQHFLLLPEYKQDALADAFGSQLKRFEGEQTTIKSDGSEEVAITVLYWHEVSRTLRQVLLNKSGLPAHWTASAYLLTTLIEQKILRHYSSPSLTQNIDAAIGVSDIDRLQSIDPEAQLEYLDDVMEGAHE